jgi:CheY-like chemotaxis protein
MDVQMPVLDGYDATREIRKQTDPNVNQALVIAMTASAIEGDREKCIEAGMNNYLAKPVRSSVLSEMLDQYLAPAKPSKLRRRPITRQSSEALRDGSGTPGSQTSSSSASQVIALTPEDERLHPRLSAPPVVSPPAVSPPVLPPPAISRSADQQLPQRLKKLLPEQPSPTNPDEKPPLPRRKGPDSSI